ncbi:forkhead box Q/D-like protein transcription factor [Saccoglossus kowalevskii]|uniref:Forkhead box Q/D-like protein transcription factor n=1 Tax=Saccoglossus kowalevskii TaxID=10224 RepID=D1LX18_SACKO|nr:forkhead box Q/D-like protein transcription factor [Saccoglossus kowalevskii]ACY92524.1 forkhead box Q/D-like protein transcription factor [Saccoglossus kowalevskii]
MCSTSSSSLIPYEFKSTEQPTMYAAWGGSGMTQAAFEFHRAQMYNYNSRLRYAGIPGIPTATAHGISPYLHHHPHGADTFTALMAFNKVDPRARLIHEEPKPSHSYIGLIAMAILKSKDRKMVLSDIYQYILDNYPYFRARGPGWRNSIRHNLSLNDCFVKAGRSANGKGHYWAIHPANIDDFTKGDFRRRRAQRKVRKHMGLSVPDDEDSPSPPPVTSAQMKWVNPSFLHSGVSSIGENAATITGHLHQPTKKRLFDVESLLAPETNENKDKSADEDDEVEDCKDTLEHDLKAAQIERNQPNTETAERISEFKSEERSSPNTETCHSPTAKNLRQSPQTNLRSSWTAPTLPPRTNGWPGSAWSIVTPSTRTTYSAGITPIPYGTPTPSPGMDTVQQWQETFSRIMAKSYSKNLQVES